MENLGTLIYIISLLRTRLKETTCQFSYYSTENMLADYFMESLKGSLFAKYNKVIMRWKHVYTLQMVSPSTR